MGETIWIDSEISDYVFRTLDFWFHEFRITSLLGKTCDMHVSPLRCTNSLSFNFKFLKQFSLIKFLFFIFFNINYICLNSLFNLLSLTLISGFIIFTFIFIIIICGSFELTPFILDIFLLIPIQQLANLPFLLSC